MRYVHYPATAVSAEWLKRAGKAAATAAGKPTAAEAATYIKARGAVWSALKETLEELSDRKCWYSEARDSVSHWQVDHYRPKSIYPWLAFTWHNLRLCGGKPNQRKSNDSPLQLDAPGAVPPAASGARRPSSLILPVSVIPSF